MPIGTLSPIALAPRRRALGVALALLAFGFVALNILTAVGAGQQGLPGLYTFRSATIGDGVLLPLLAYSLIRSADIRYAWLKQNKKIVLSGTVVACLAGAALQVDWLVNPHPRLNWTLPAPHRFNFPGWYHAGFLVAACGFFAGAAVAAFLRIRQETRVAPGSGEARVRSVGILGVLMPGPAFAALLVTDNAPARQHLPWVSVVVVLAVALILIFVLCWSIGRPNLRWGVIAGIASVIPAISLFALFPQGPMTGYMTLLPAVSAGLVGIASSSALHVRPGIDRLLLAAPIGLCAAGPVYAVSSQESATLSSLMAGCAAGIALLLIELVLLRALLVDVAVRVRIVVALPLALSPIIALGLAGRYFAREQENANSYGNITGAVSAALLLAVTAWAVRILFDPVIEAEKAVAPARELSALKWRAYLAISTTYAAALLAFTAFISGTTSASNWTNGRGGDYGTLMLLAAGLLTVCILLWGTAAARRTAVRPDGTAPPVHTFVAAAACLVWACIMMKGLSSGYSNWKQLALSIIVALVSGLFVLEGVIGNTAYLQNLGVDWQVLTVGGCSSLAVALTTAWMTGPALAPAGSVNAIGYSLTSLAVGVTACALIPFVAARSLSGASPTHQYTMAKPLAGVLQDCFMVTLLAVSAAWAPNLFLAHVKSVSAWWGVVFSHLALLSAAYVYVMHNNVEHVEREKQRRAALGTPMPTDQQKAQDALARHIRRQNYLAAVALFPLGIFAIFSELTGFNANGLSEILRVQ